MSPNLVHTVIYFKMGVGLLFLRLPHTLIAHDGSLVEKGNDIGNFGILLSNCRCLPGLRGIFQGKGKHRVRLACCQIRCLYEWTLYTLIIDEFILPFQ